MLRLTGLRLNNFGPFKGEQFIEFPEDDGVTIVYGENMRGKTSLLNAIRFAFFGRVVGSGRREAKLRWPVVVEWRDPVRRRHRVRRRCRRDVSTPPGLRTERLALRSVRRPRRRA